MFARVALAFLFCHAALTAQTTNSVTVIASQSAAQLDSAAFAITVTSGFDATVEAVVNSVSSLGLTAANLVGIGPPAFFVDSSTAAPSRSAAPQEQWTFELVVPLTQMKSTAAALAALQKSFAAGFSLSWTVSGTQTPGSAAACNLADLAAQANTQAQAIATAAAVKLGPVSRLAISGCSLTASYALSTAQPGARVLLATASQPLAAMAPDQVNLYLQVGSPVTATLSGITAALAKAGISGVTFTGAAQQNQLVSPLVPPLIWTFTETVPLSKLAATLAQLTVAQRKFGGGLTLSFAPQGFSYSQQPSCPEAGLLSQAQTLAQNVAVAAGTSAGPLLSMSSGAGTPTAATRPPFPSFLLAAPPATCSLTAQFQLL
ncbi:MAG TPA: hypothetical protein VKV17_23595 [Bryobacteraceae bacterium]|nr:hypothetical protein [Bryobacteraceae bacterium]